MPPPRLVLAAHGTRSAAGSATTARLAAAVRAARPELAVALCFLDVAEPTLADALAGNPGAAVVVPLLLATGYHVLSDIPAIAARHPSVVVAGHLGPDPLVIAAVADLLPLGRSAAAALVGVGSSRPEARLELDAAGARLAGLLGAPVRVCTLFDDVAGELAELPAPRQVAAYLLAEGEFHDRLVAAAAGLAEVSAPIGAHPEIVRLVLARYDRAAGSAGSARADRVARARGGGRAGSVPDLDGPVRP